MKTAWLSILVVLIAVVSSNAVAELTVAEVVQKVKPAVVTIITYNAAGEEDSQGTGFLIAADRVVTNYHVIEGAAKAKVKSASGKMYSVKGLVGSDRIADIAILVLTEPVKGAKVLTLSKSLPKVGEKIVVVGTPLGLELTASDGIVSAVRDMPGMGKVIQITAPVSPGSSGSPVVDLAGAVVGVARAIMREGQNLNFAVASSYVLSIKPTSTTSLGVLPRPPAGNGASDWEKGIAFFPEYEKALPCFEAATKADPSDGLAWYYLGFCCDELGRNADAVVSYKQAIRINPDDDSAHNALGTCYVEMGRYAEAVDECKQATSINPNSAVAHFNLGSIYIKLQRDAEAVEELKQAIRIVPDYADAHYSLGSYYGELGRLAGLPMP